MKKEPLSANELENVMNFMTESLKDGLVHIPVTHQWDIFTRAGSLSHKSYRRRRPFLFGNS